MIDAMMVNGTVKEYVLYNIIFKNDISSQLCMDRKDCVENILVLGLARLMLCFEEDIRKETIHFVDMLGKGENIKSYEMWLVDRGIQVCRDAYYPFLPNRIVDSSAVEFGIADL